MSVSGILDYGDRDIRVRSLVTVGGDIYSPEFSVTRTKIAVAESQITRLTLDLDAASSRLEDVRNGDVIDGAIDRLKLDAGFLSEFVQTQSEIFPNGLAASSRLTLMEPQYADTYAMAEGFAEALYNAEQGINGAMMKVDGNVTKIAAFEHTLDIFSSLIGELTTAVEGGVPVTVDYTIITQTAEKVRTMALSGTFVDGGTTYDTWEKGQIDVMSDKIGLLVQSDGVGGWKTADLLITTDNISLTVASAVATDAGVKAAIASIITTDNSLILAVESLRGESLERLDEMLVEAHAGILVTANLVQIEAQSRSAQGTVLTGMITVESDRITSEVSERVDGDTLLGTQIIQAKDAINLAVWGATTPGGTPLSTQVALVADQFSAQVSGYGSRAFLALSVTLPAFLPMGTRASWVTTHAYTTAARFDAVYFTRPDGTYAIPDTCADSDFRALKSDMRTAGVLGSQIALDADEILMGGKVHAKDIDVVDLNASGLVTMTAAKITGQLVASQINTEGMTIGSYDTLLAGKASTGSVSTAQAAAELAAKNALAVELGYADYATMVTTIGTTKKTVIAGGYINTEMIDVVTLMAKDLLVKTGGAVRGGGYALDGTGTTQGFWLGANGVLKADSAEFVNCEVTGDFNGGNISPLLISSVAAVTAGGNILRRSLTPQLTTSAAAVCLHEFHVPASGHVNVVFDFRETSGSGVAYARVYKNGSAFGVQQGTAGSVTNFIEDTTVSVGDYISVFAWTTGGGVCEVRNVYLKIAETPGLLAFLN